MDGAVTDGEQPAVKDARKDEAFNATGKSDWQEPGAGDSFTPMRQDFSDCA